MVQKTGFSLHSISSFFTDSDLPLFSPPPTELISLAVQVANVHYGQPSTRMQLLTGAEHFGNVIFGYSELPSQYHIDASIDVNRPRQDWDVTCLLLQVERLVRAPFLLQSPEEENKK